MKRFIIVCLSLFLFSFFIIPSFAEEIVLISDDYSLRDISSGDPYSSLSFYPSLVYSHPPVDVSVSTSGYIFLDGVRTSFSSVYFHSSFSSYILTYNDGSSHFLIDDNGSFLSSWDGVLYFDSPVRFNSSFVDWYNSFPSPIEQGVSSGVSSFISWTGNVISNLVMSPALIVLVGLSIALLVVLPWGISKLKSLIKGY